MAKPIDITDTAFSNEVLNSSEPVLVDFWAPWCGYCKKENPVIDDLANEYAGKVKVVKINIDQNQDKAREFGIQGVPSLLLFKNGQLKAKTAGFHSKSELEQLINKYAA